jgi:hypothetical protein
MTATEILRKHGIDEPFGHDGRRFCTTCPQCSNKRTTAAHKNAKVLGVTIEHDHVEWGCNHCGWKGGESYKPNGHRPNGDNIYYVYQGQDGEAVSRKVRGPIKNGEKTFWWQHPDGNGGWAKGGGSKKVLYRLPELTEDIALGHPIVIPEGEKDVDTLRAIGVPATCNPDGAPKPGQKPKWRREFSETLRGADLIIIPDHDEQGYAHAEAIATMSAGVAKSVRVLKLADHWPDCPKGGDVSDWLAKGHTREELDALLEQAKAPEANGTDLDEWDAGDDPGFIPPREWLLGNQFCRSFISSIVAAGGCGKSALRLLQFISLATGRPLCGQHVFKRCRILLLSLEDDRRELNRRIKAVLVRYNIDRRELKGWLFCRTAPKLAKLAIMKNGIRAAGPLEQQLRATIERRKIDLVSLDPFIKTHELEENTVGDMNYVCELLAQMGIEYNIAVDSPHHVHKGTITPGDADSGRGSSGIRHAGRLNYTLVPMSIEEAEAYGINPDDRHDYIRLDPAKVNITRKGGPTTWFHLVGVPIGNRTEDYPNGDTIQTVESWTPPDTWADISTDTVNAILSEIDVGLRADDGKPNGCRYGIDARGKRAAWTVVQQYCPKKSEAQCREIVRTWDKNELLISKEYHDPEQRRKIFGLYVDDAKRPGVKNAA